MVEVSLDNSMSMSPTANFSEPPYYRARYYDPNVGRFLSEDEVGNDTGLDLYIYVGSSPLDSRDPTGLYGPKGFSPGDAQKMRDGINSAINALGKGCEGCAGSFAVQRRSAVFHWGFSGAPYQNHAGLVLFAGPSSE